MKKYLVACILSLLSLSLYSQDLVVTGFEGQTTYDQYQKSQLKVFVKNDGIVPIVDDYYLLHAYLSPDQVYDSYDEYFGSSFMPAELAPGETATVEISDMNFADPGTYYLILIVDAYGYVAETDDDNNTLVVPEVVIGPPNVDFQIATIDGGGGAPAGDLLWLEVTVSKTGSPDVACRFLDRFFLSSDMILDQSDHFLGEHFQWYDDQITQPYMPASSVPFDVEPGEYFLLGQVDSDEDVDETDEGNNVFVSGKVVVLPSDIDLEPGISSADIYNNSIRLDYSITNHGTTGTARYEASLYISTDATIGPDDQRILLRDYWPNDLKYAAPGRTNWHNANEYIGSLQPGEYYLMLVVNESGYMPETAYHNNTAFYGPLYLAPPALASVTIETATFAGTYTTVDTDFSLDVGISNNGDASNRNLPYTLTLKNAGGSSVHTTTQWVYTNFTGPATEEWTLELANTLPIGEYTLEITSNDWESNTTFLSVPLTISPATYSLTGVVQGTDGTPITAGKLFLYVKESSGTIKFINKKEFTTDNHFEHSLDDKEYTLYFIPDRVAFPQHVPTIFGKTVVLKPTSFFTMNADDDIVLEILTLEPMEEGSMVISGNVQNSGGRVARSLSDLPVILLNSDGEPVRITNTDHDGSFMFTDLPPAEYQIVFAFELDQYNMEEPILVDASEQNAIVSVDFNDGTMTTTTTYEPIMSTESGTPALSIYPNPVNDYATVSIAGDIRSTRVTTASGMDAKIPLTAGNTFDFTGHSAGVYIVHIQTTGGKSIVSKVIKK